MATVIQPLRSDRKVDYGYFLYFGLHVAGFLATTLLMTWGIMVLFFILIGGFSLDGMMHHVANLSTRYVAADEGRISHFKLIVGAVQLVLAIAIIFFRRHSLLPRSNARAGAANND